MPVVRLLELMPGLEVLCCHLHWQFPDRQRTFWASGPLDVLATRVQSLHTLDFLGFKNDVADFVNDVTATPLFEPRDVCLRLRCDCSDTTPTFDEVDAFNDEVEHLADEFEVDFRARSMSTSRRSGEGHRIIFTVRWELTNTSIGHWVRTSLLFYARRSSSHSSVIRQSAARSNLVDDRLVEYVNSNFQVRVPRSISIIGGDLSDIFDDVICHEMESLRLTGSMAYLLRCMPYIHDNLDIFPALTTMYYTATPPFGLDMPLTYCWVVAGGQPLDPLPVATRYITVHLRLPSMAPVQGRYLLRTATVRWNTSIPVESVVTIDPPTDTPF